MDPENRCLECGRIRLREFRKTNPERIRKQGSWHKRFSRYGITPSIYDEMLSAQEGKCAICGIVPKEDALKRTLHVDHCHSTGMIRGLLCQNCNLMLGFSKDSAEILLRAIEYLK